MNCNLSHKFCGSFETFDILHSKRMLLLFGTRAMLLVLTSDGLCKKNTPRVVKEAICGRFY